MNNTYIMIIEILLCFLLMIFLYKKEKINGLYYYISILIIISSLMSLKTIELYIYNLNLGIIPLTTVFIASNLIIQKKGSEEIKKLILTILTTSIINYLIIYLIVITQSSEINLFTNASFNNIFIESPRIYFANIVTILYTLFFNSKLYYYLKKEKNKIWISNIFTNIIIQFIVSILFTLIAFAITKNTIDILKLIMIRYILSLIVSIIGTPILYILNNLKEK